MTAAEYQAAWLGAYDTAGAAWSLLYPYLIVAGSVRLMFALLNPRKS